MSNPIDDVLQAIPDNHMIHITGGMNWQGFRRSTNIEDRRSEAAVQRDQAWFGSRATSTIAAQIPTQPPDKR